MREILFRAKRTDNGEWINGYYVRQDETSYCFKEDYESHPENTKHYIAFDMQTDWGLPNRHIVTEIDPETLCQYTGLTDKNGKKVFIGDIIRCSKGCPHEVIWLQEYGGTYIGGMPAVYLSDLFKGYAWTGEEEKIGNIFDDPELLKGE